MVDVRGLVTVPAHREWQIKTERCNMCPVSTPKMVLDLEWSLRNSIQQTLILENENYNLLFEKHPKLEIKCNVPLVDDPLEFALRGRTTLGVFATVGDWKTPVYPILFQGKMFQIIFNARIGTITKEVWDSFRQSQLDCLFCGGAKGNDNIIWPSIFLLKGKLYTVGNLAWANFNRVIDTAKLGGPIMYTRNETLSLENCTFLHEFKPFADLLKKTIGNKRVFNSSLISKMFYQCVVDLHKHISVVDKTRLDFRVRNFLRRQCTILNTGILDSVIGKRTNFLASLKENRHFDQFRTGRFKNITKIDYTLICKLFNLDIMVSRYAKKIPIEFCDADLGFICPVSTSEQNPGLMNLEIVIGTFISCEEDVVPGGDRQIVEILQTSTRLGGGVRFELVTEPTEIILPNPENPGRIVIINNSIYKDINSIFKCSDMARWIEKLRQVLKLKFRCIEVYAISETLYVIYSYTNTLFRYMSNGLAYSAMELALDSVVQRRLENDNLHGPSCATIPFINCNKSSRNTFIVHSTRQTIGYNMSSKYDFLTHRIDLLSKEAPICELPFWLQRVNVLMIPQPYNVADSFILSSRSVIEKDLFTFKHTYIANVLIRTLSCNDTIFARAMVDRYPNIKPGMVFMKFTNTKNLTIINVGKHLSLVDDPDSKSITNIIWNPNVHFIDKGVQVDLIETTVCFYKLENQLSYSFKIVFLERPKVGSKVVINCQKGIIGRIYEQNELPELIDIETGQEFTNEIDIVQSPMSIKRLAFNFLYSSSEDENVYLKDCFDHTTAKKLRLLESRKDYFIKNKSTGEFYLDLSGKKSKAIVYTAFAMYMWKQSPSTVLHSAELGKTSTNELTTQPECRNVKYSNSNSHAFGLSESERETLGCLGSNSVIESLYDMSDPEFMTLDGIVNPLSESTKRVLDMLYLNNLNFNFNFSDQSVYD
jgi:hypothetical protein